MLHLGSGMSTFIIDGNKCPFYHRNIYFSADDVLADTEDDPAGEREQKLEALLDEITRTLTFYKQTNSVADFDGLFLLGEYASSPGLCDMISERTGLPAAVIHFAEKAESNSTVTPGKFDLAISLAMRTDFAKGPMA